MKKLCLIFLIFLAGRLYAADSLNPDVTYFYPKAYKTWNYNFIAGLSLTKLPMAVVEEEINTSPMPSVGMRLGMPANFSLFADFGSNYISNFGSLGLQWSFLNKRISAGVGVRFTGWWGHLDMEAFRIKSSGLIGAPYAVAGFDLGDFTLTGEFSIENNYIYTTSDDVYLGEWYHPFSNYAFKFGLEQPMWNNNYVLLGIKFNYAKFYYQSWLSFTTFNEYLMYPEFYFSFIF